MDLEFAHGDQHVLFWIGSHTDLWKKQRIAMDEDGQMTFGFADTDGGTRVKSKTQARKADPLSLPRPLLNLEEIEPDPEHPRHVIAEDDIAALVTSIKQHGVQQPILVRYDPGSARYIIIDGVIRFRAAQRCNLKDIPAHVIVCNDPRLIRAMLELTHKSLHPVDLAETIAQAAEKWNGKDGEFAEILGRQQSEISRSRRIACLSAPVKTAMRARNITFSVAQELAHDSLTDAIRLDLLKKPRDLTTDRLRAVIEKAQQKRPSPAAVTVAKALLSAMRRGVRWLKDDGVTGDPLNLSIGDVMDRLEAFIKRGTDTSR
jgi:ParB family chromosome partitioning protein